MQIEKRPFTLQDVLTIGLLLVSVAGGLIAYHNASEASIEAVRKDAASRQEVLDAIARIQENEKMRDEASAARAEQIRKEAETRAAEIRNDLVSERQDRSAQILHNEEKRDATDRLLFDAIQRLNGVTDQLNQRLRGHSELSSELGMSATR